MTTPLFRQMLVVCGAAAITVACTSSTTSPDASSAAEPVPEDPRMEVLRSLPQASDLPPGYGPAGELAGRGMFYAAGEVTHRIDDGNHYHGYDGPGVWAQEPKGVRTQGVVYGVEDGAIVSAGYLIRQTDLVASKSFHGLTLRELPFPPAYTMTADFIPGQSEDENVYLWLWHFLPPDDARPMLAYGELPSKTSLPEGFVVTACDQFEDLFCPGMGRHFTDPDPTLSRLPTSEGNAGVIYGEAAGKLIFIEYVFSQEDFAAGVSWPAMPLSGIPIPPIDNVHVLHFGTGEEATGRYTVHMYFLPEDVYLAWETEPEELS